MITLIIIVILESILLAWMIKNKMSFKRLVRTLRHDIFIHKMNIEQLRAVRDSLKEELNKW